MRDSNYFPLSGDRQGGLLDEDDRYEEGRDIDGPPWSSEQPVVSADNKIPSNVMLPGSPPVRHFINLLSPRFFGELVACDLSEPYFLLRRTPYENI